jgi:hypothetical protein
VRESGFWWHGVGGLETTRRIDRPDVEIAAETDALGQASPLRCLSVPVLSVGDLNGERDSGDVKEFRCDGTNPGGPSSTVRRKV